jgi:hypothetical protein
VKYDVRHHTIEAAERESARILARMEDDTLMRAHGRWYWVSDKSRESASRIARMQREGTLRVVDGIAALVGRSAA